MESKEQGKQAEEARSVLQEIEGYICDCNLGVMDSITCDRLNISAIMKFAESYASMRVSEAVEANSDWTLSRERMPDFDGSYYVYGFMHHECGNITHFYKVAECKMNQWVKSDIGEQYTYWRKNLPPPEIKDQEQQFMESL